MNDSKITTRYAKALFNLSLETGKLAAVKNDIEMIYNVSNEVDLFNEVVHSPIIKTSKKKEIFKNIFAGQIDKTTSSFLDLVTENKREMFLKQMCLNFLALYRDLSKIKQVEIVTTEKLTPDFKNQITDIIRSTYNCTVEFNEKIDKNIIGGFILTIDDKQIDASVSTKLKKIEKELKSSVN